MKKVLGKVSIFALVLAGGLLMDQAASADTSYTIQQGDSFYLIAQKHGLDPNTLAASNGLGIYDLIVPGQVLTIPGYQAPATAVENPAPAVASSSSSSNYTVQAGDSFSSIAATYGMDFNQLASNNGLNIYSTIVPGQILQVTAPAGTRAQVEATSSYYLPGYTYEPGVNYPVGQCTWAVQKLTGWAGDWWGNASQWAENAFREGFAVGTTPAVGAIAVWNDGGFGHVALVTGVDGNNIQVLEANINGRQWIDNHRGWFNPNASSGHLSYIYAP
jgi:surface antigen